jgi:hypothetical protein
MSSCFTITCPSDGCYANYLCDIEKENRIVAAVLVKKGVAITKTTAAAWLSSLFTACLEGNGFLILNISGEKPRPDTAELPGRGKQLNKPGGKTHTLNFTDMQGVVNVDFYNKIARTSKNFDLYYFTPDLIWDVAGETISLVADPVITADLNTYIGSEGTIKWVSKGNPLPCEFNVDTLLDGLFYEITGTTDPDFSIEVANGGTATSIFNASLNYTLISNPDLVWSVSAPSNDDFTISVDSTTGIVTVIAPAMDSQTTTFTLTVTNIYGCIFGEQIVTAFTGITP